MGLKLNETPRRYKDFYGSNVVQMPILIAEGRVPLSVAGLMQARLDVRNASKKVKSSWMDNYFDTGDAILYHPDGRVKVVLDSQHFREMGQRPFCGPGALDLLEGVYESLQGQEFTRRELREHVGWRRLSKKQAKANPIWRALARDQDLLGDYVDYIFAEAKERFDWGTRINDWGSTRINMGMAINFSYDGDVPKLGSWLKSWRIGELVNRSYASGMYNICYNGGRLVGEAPEAKHSKP